MLLVAARIERHLSVAVAPATATSNPMLLVFTRLHRESSLLSSMVESVV